MAPKGKANTSKPSPKAASSPAPTKVATPKPAAKAKSQKESLSVNAARVNRDIAVKVRRTLKERFSDFTQEQIHEVLYEGKNLHTTLTNMYHYVDRIQDGRILLLRAHFQKTAEVIPLVPITKKLKVSEAMQRAVAYSIMTCMSDRDRTQLYGVMAMAKEINEKEWCLIMTSIRNLAYLNSPSNPTHIKEVLKLALFRNFNTKFPRLFNLMTPFYLRVLLADLADWLSSASKASGNWWCDHRHLCGWHVDLASIDELFDTAANTPDRHLKIVEVSKASILAQTLFASELAGDSSKAFVAHINTKCKELLDAKPLTDELFEAASEFMFQKAEEFLANSGQSAITLELKVNYRGLELEDTIKDPFRFIDLIMAHVIRCSTIGFETEGIEALGPEAICMPLEKKAGKPPLKLELYRDVQIGRRYFNRELMNSGKDTALAVYAWAKGKESQFMSKDRSFSLDLLLLYKICNGVGDEELQKQILTALPSETEPMSFNDVERKFDAIKDSTLWKFLDPSVTGPLAIVMNLVHLAQRGVLPVERFKSLSGFGAKVGARLQWFCSHVQWLTINSKLQSQRIYGHAALAAKLKVVYEKKDDPNSVGDVVAEVLQYKFMLQAEDLEKMEEIGAKCTVVPVVASSSKPAAKKPRLEKKSNFELAMEATANLFDDE